MQAATNLRIFASSHESTYFMHAQIYVFLQVATNLRIFCMHKSTYFCRSTFTYFCIWQWMQVATNLRIFCMHKPTYFLHVQSYVFWHVAHPADLSHAQPAMPPLLLPHLHDDVISTQPQACVLAACSAVLQAQPATPLPPALQYLHKH